MIRRHKARSTQTSGPSWKPITLSPWILLTLASFTALLGSVIIYLLYENVSHGSVYQFDGDSAVANIIFQYFPIILALCYGIFWSWIDLDIKRLEPWFQLSSFGEFRCNNALLLQYPSDFSLIIPFKSAKRRHWLVFSSSLATLLIFWGLTPLQGSLFANQKVNLISDRTISLYYGLQNPGNSSHSLGLDILYSAFAVQWFSQALPSFTTNTTAITPFVPDIHTRDLPEGSRIVYNTTVYSSDLDCWTPTKIDIDRQTGSLTFDDGRGCVAKNIVAVATPSDDSGANFTGYYIGWYSDDRLSFSLADSGCPQNASHRFLAIWMRETNNTSFDSPATAAALFCEPRYFQQQVRASISLLESSVIDYKALGEPEPLKSSQFNITLFEYIIGSGLMPIDGEEVQQADIPDLTTLNPSIEMANLGLAVPTSNMVPFALGAAHLPLEAYLNTTVLAQSFRAAHQIVFAFAAQKLLSGAAPSSNISTATIVILSNGIVVVDAIAGILIGLLVFILALNLHILIRSRPRKSLLQKDPNSIARVLENIAGKESFTTVCAYATNHDQTSDDLANHSCRSAGAKHLLYNKVTQDFIDLPKGSVRRTTEHTARGREKSLYHGSSRLRILIVILMLATVLTTIVILQIYISRGKGLFLPNMSIILQQILLNYLPTAATTVIDPLWTEITRSSSTLQPLHDLASGLRSAETSLQLNYATIPTQIVAWKAFKGRHYLIAVLGLTGLFSNILTIALNNLFYVSQTVSISDVTMNNLNIPSIDLAKWNATRGSSSAGFYAFYVTTANITSQASLPPWQGQHHYFLPQNITHNQEAVDAYSVVTTGLGATLDCDNLNSDSANSSFNLSFDPTMTTLNFVVTFRNSEAKDVECVAGLFFNRGNGNITISGDPSGFKAIEIIRPLSAPEGANDTSQAEFCSKRFLAGWLRTDAAAASFSNDRLAASSDSVQFSISKFSATLLSCNVNVESALYNVTVSPSGTVKTSNRTSSLTSSISLTSALDPITSSISSTSQQVAVGTSPRFQNDSFASDWLNYLIKEYTNSSSFLDPNLPPPNATEAATLLSDVYARSWAALLAVMSPTLEKADSSLSNIVTGHSLSTVNKVFMNQSMFYLAIAIISWNIAVAIVVLLKTPSPFLPRPPTSIANIASFFEHSHCIDNLLGSTVDVTDERPKSFEQSTSEHSQFSTSKDKHGLSERYAYGPFVDTQGVARVGIDVYPHAVPLHLQQRRSWKFWQ